MVLHELFFLSSSFPARVRAQAHVRSDLDALPFAPFFFSGPFPLFSGPFGGIRFALCQDSLQFVTARALEKGARFTFLPVPVAFPPSSSLRLARALSGSHVSGAPQVQPQSSAASRLLPPLVFCRQAYGPCLSSSFHLAPFALASPAPAQHEFLHSSWLSSVLALFSLSAPCPPWIPPWLATVRVTRRLVRLAKSSREKASFSPRSWSSRATPWAA